METFCEYLKEHTMKTVSFEKKKTNSIKKQIAGISCKGKNLLHLQKKV